MQRRRYPHSDFAKETYYKKSQFRERLLVARNAGRDALTNFIRMLCNTLQARRERGQIRIRDIIEEGWEDFKKENAAKLTRPGVIENVEKALKCGQLENGYRIAECPECDNYVLIRFTCKSRFCPSCGKKYRDLISLSVQKKLYNVPHRQFVFSVPERLRPWFRKYRGRLDVLFDSVAETFNGTIFQSAPVARKKENRKLGFISFLHTFGRDLKWHPHLHVLVAESYSANDGKLHHISFFPFEAMRKRFRYTLLTAMERWLRENAPGEARAFRRLSRKAKQQYREGFYVYGPRRKAHRLTDFAMLARYVARYASHPPISEGRIDRFDKEAGTVTWHYDPHEDDRLEEGRKRGRQYVTDSISGFIARLLIHIPDGKFHQIRYYGFYSNRTTSVPRHRKMAGEGEISEARLFLRWEARLMSVYGYSPLICECGTRMRINHRLSYFPGMEFEEWKRKNSG